MDAIVWLGIAAAVLIALLAAGYVIWPLLQPGPTLPLVEDSRLTELLVRKDILLRSIKELEFDYQMGKIAPDDYTRFAARLRRQAIGVMEQIDSVTPAGREQDRDLEAEIARLRTVEVSAPSEPNGSTVSADPVTSRDDLHASAEQPATNGAHTPDSVPSAQRPREQRFCTQCGKPVGVDHKFCAECGAPLPAATR